MAMIYQKYKSEIVDGKRVDALDKRGKKIPLNWFARVVLHDGRRKKVKLAARTETEAKKEAQDIESRQRQMKNGTRPIPTSSDKAGFRPIGEVMDEYIEWGKMQGGRGGRPWNEAHAREKMVMLRWWRQTLNFDSLADVNGCLPSVEKALRDVAIMGRPDTRKLKNKKPLSGKTLSLMVESLRSFFSWCALPSRRYLTGNPLEGMKPIDATPKTQRRALSIEEIRKILNAAPIHFQMLIKTALCTGFRKGELRALTVNHLDAHNCTLRVDAEDDKGRKERFQPVPKWLVDELSAYAKTGEAARLYSLHYRRKEHTADTLPKRPLLFVPEHAARLLVEVAEKAGVESMNAQGKIDFHALRTAYINLLLGNGTDIKTVQTLARHASLDMTMNVYGRARQDFMCEAVEKVGEVVCFQGLGPSGVPHDKSESAIPFDKRGCMDASSGSNPVSPTSCFSWQPLDFQGVAFL